MSKYADLYLVPIAEEKVAEYRKLAKAAGKIFIRHGALKYREYVASDLDPQGAYPFPKLVKLKPGQTIIYAAVEFNSESHRNKVMKAVMADTELASMMDGKEPPFDYRKMAYGGFKVIVDL